MLSFLGLTTHQRNEKPDALQPATDPKKARKSQTKDKVKDLIDDAFKVENEDELAQ